MQSLVSIRHQCLALRLADDEDGGGEDLDEVEASRGEEDQGALVVPVVVLA